MKTHPVANYMLALESRRSKPSKLQEVASAVGRRQSGLAVVLNLLKGTAESKG